MKKSVKALAALMLCLLLAFVVYVPGVKAEEGEPQAGYTATDKMPTTSGKYYLTKDIVLTSGAKYVDGVDVTIDLMGHNITQSTAGKTVFNMEGGKVTVEDSTATGSGSSYKAGIISAAKAPADANQFGGQIVSAKGSSMFVLKGGILDGSANIDTVFSGPDSGSVWGGAIWMGGEGVKIQIDGGVCRNFSHYYGAVIGGTKFTSVVINGGDFYGNVAKRGKKTDGSANNNAGGGVIAVFTDSSAPVNEVVINGGTFHNNEAYTGGVVLINCTGTNLTVNGGEFYANKTDNSAGAIRVYSKYSPASTVVIKNASFHNNTAATNGGAIYFGIGKAGTTLGEMTISNSRFFQNKTNNGNGAAIGCTANLTLDSVTVVNNFNKTGTKNGAIYMEKYSKAAATDPAPTLTLKGIVCIKDNMSAGKASDLYFMSTDAYSITADVSALTGGEIRYDVQNAAKAFGINATEAKKSLFIPDQAGKVTAFAGGELSMTDGTAIADYKITAGADAEYETGSGKELSFTTDGPMDKLEDVVIDGRAIDPANYTIDGQNITFKSSFLDTLSGKTDVNPDGKHTLSFSFTGSRCEAVQFATPNGGPETGDSSLLLLWVSLIALAALGFVVLKKKGYQD